MVTADLLYERFFKALEYSIQKKGRGAQKAAAIDAQISQPALSHILSKKSRKRAGLDTQIKLATAFGYEYEDFLKLGRSLIEKKTYPDNQKKCSEPNLTKEVPQKDAKVGKKMDVQELKELLQHYKEELKDIRRDKKEEIAEFRLSIKEDLSALRSEIDYLRKRNRELEGQRSQTQTSESPSAAAGGAEKKTA